MELDAYIQTAYTLADPAPADVPGLYEDHHRLLKDELPRYVRYVAARSTSINEIPFEFHVIYAFEKRSSAVFGESRIALIHNRLYGQTLNNLNKLFWFTQNSFPSFCYMFRLVEEELYVQGLPKFGFALRAMRNHGHMTDEYKKIFKENAGTFEVFIQELFILVHEACHLLIEAQILSKDALVASARASIMAYQVQLERVREDGRFSELVADSGDDLAQMLHSLPGLAADDHMCEEIACDTFALGFLSEVYRASDELLFLAISMLFRHDRILNYIKRCILSSDNTGIFHGVVYDTLRTAVIGMHASNKEKLSESLISLLRSSQMIYDTHYNRISKIVLNAVRRTGNVLSVADMQLDIANRRVRIQEFAWKSLDA